MIKEPLSIPQFYTKKLKDKRSEPANSFVERTNVLRHYTKVSSDSIFKSSTSIGTNASPLPFPSGTLPT